MDTKNDGGSVGGMTLRQWYAGMALQGLMSACNTQGDWTIDPIIAVGLAINAADTMIKKLEKRETS